MAKYDLHLKGFVGDFDFDADYVDYILDKFSDRQVTVCIDSTGGSLAAGLSIAGAFRNHGDVSVHFVGLNASAATIAALGAKEVTMDAQAMYLVHKCSASVIECVSLNSDELAAKIKELEQTKAALDQFDLSAAQAYAARCKKDPKDLYDLMAVGGWLTASEALDWGFVDRITSNAEDPAPVLDQITASAFSASGIPMPKISADRDRSHEDPEGSALVRLINRICDFFSHSNSHNSMDNLSSSVQTDANASAEQTVTAQAQPAAPISGDTEMVDATADASASEKPDPRDAEIARLRQENADLKARVDAMPADTHARVVENAKPANDPYFADLHSAKKLFDSLP